MTSIQTIQPVWLEQGLALSLSQHAMHIRRRLEDYLIGKFARICCSGLRYLQRQAPHASILALPHPSE